MFINGFVELPLIYNFKWHIDLIYILIKTKVHYSYNFNTLTHILDVLIKLSVRVSMSLHICYLHCYFWCVSPGWKRYVHCKWKSLIFLQQEPWQSLVLFFPAVTVNIKAELFMCKWWQIGVIMHHQQRHKRPWITFNYNC